MARGGEGNYTSQIDRQGRWRAASPPTVESWRRQRASRRQGRTAREGCDAVRARPGCHYKPQYMHVCSLMRSALSLHQQGGASSAGTAIMFSRETSSIFSSGFLVAARTNPVRAHAHTHTVFSLADRGQRVTASRKERAAGPCWVLAFHMLHLLAD